MKKNELNDCPICNSDKTISILDLDCGNFDNSALYQSVRINVCEQCGHVYNGLSSDEIKGLVQYYNEEYAPANIGATDKTGDRPGSNNHFTFMRYGQLYNLISSFITSDSKVLDVGCAMGGFLDYLHNHGLNNLSGIDLTENYIRYAIQKGNYNIKLGSAELIPFADRSFDFLVTDQVMEHLSEPKVAFKEARRVLVDGGLLCIGVPDASRYDETYFFDFYWFIMREHIQHFDIEHLKLLAGTEGFELVGFNKSETPMMSEKMILPNLNVIFRLTGNTNKLNIAKDCFKLRKKIEQYVANEFERLNDKKAIFDQLIISQKPIYVWGMGREFLYLYESVGLKYCNIVGLIDVNPYKQNTFLIDGKRIVDKSILGKATPDSSLIISAIAHTDQIKNILPDINYCGQLLEF